LWLVVFLVGLPAVLVRYVGWPLPDHSPTRDDWQRWAAQPLTRTALLDSAAIIAWLLWAGLVYAVIVEILTRTRRVAGWPRGRQLPPLPTPMQATASGMLGAAVFGMPTGTAQPVAAQPVAPASPVQPVAAQPAAAQALPAAADTAGATDPAPSPGQPTADGGHTSPAHADSRPAQPAGVELPDGGWVTHNTATTIAAAATLVWLQRRRRYLPRPPIGAARDDADLTPLPATVAAVQDGLRRQYVGDDDPDDEDAASVAQAEPAVAVAATIGQRAGAPLHLQDLPAGGVGLVGAGAADAARGLLTAVLLSGHRSGQHAQLVTTVADLQALLATNTGHHPDTPGLTVADSLDDAIAHLEDAALTRGQRPAIDHGDVPSTAVDRAAKPDRLPPLVLLTGCPTDPAVARRLAVILTLAAPLGITGVLLHAWPHGTNWQVGGDGTTHSPDTPTTTGFHLQVLTADATTDLLGLAREAHPNAEEQAPGPAEPRPPDARPAIAPSPARTVPPARPCLRLRLLGPPTIHTGDSAQPLHLSRSAGMQILAFLAVNRDGATSGQLAAALWPGLRPHAATRRLYTPIGVLRSTLHDTTGADVIVRDGERYRLDEQHIDVDLWRLHAAVEHAATALKPTDRQRALRAVIDTYTGELGAGRKWPWLAPHREAARRHVVDAYAALAATQPHPTAALTLLQDAIRTDPFNEDLHRRAMRGYAAAGDPTAARQLLAGLTGRLTDAGIQPGDDVRQFATEMDA
jgi:DNA-binding SARP family transcriptional activator